MLRIGNERGARAVSASESQLESKWLSARLTQPWRPTRPAARHPCHLPGGRLAPGAGLAIGTLLFDFGRGLATFGKTTAGRGV